MWYTFTQMHDQVAVSFLMPRDAPPGAKPKVEITPETLSAAVGDCVLVSGKLYARVNHYESLWQIETVRGQKTVTIHLEKETLIEWPVLIMEDEEHDMDPTSCFHLAEFLETHDPPRALDLYERAAAKNHVPSILKVAAFYEIGHENAVNVPVARDAAKSFEWHLRAANMPVDEYNGEYVAEASYIVATAYQGGHNAQRNPANAVQYFDRAIDITSSELERLARYAAATGSVTPPPQGTPTMGAAAAGGAAGAPIISAQPAGSAAKLRTLMLTCAFQAGLTHFEGDATAAAGGGGGAPNYRKAREYWERSADLGHAQSLYNLGVLYLNGRGVDRDLPRAHELMARAARSDPSGRLQVPEGLAEAAAAADAEDGRGASPAASLSASIASGGAGGGGHKKHHKKKRRKHTAGGSEAQHHGGAGVGTSLLWLSVLGAISAGAYWYLRIKPQQS